LVLPLNFFLSQTGAASEDHGRRSADRACSWSSSAILDTWLDQAPAGSGCSDHGDDHGDWGPDSAMALSAQVSVRLKSTGVLGRLGPRSTDHFSRAKLTTSPEFLPKFLEGGKQAMAGSVIQRHIVKIA